MHIAVLGATSQIAKDLILAVAAERQHEFTLFARQPALVGEWLAGAGLAGRYRVTEFSTFGADGRFDAVLNFVGVGNPAQAVAMGASIFDVTLQYDELALDYVRKHPACRYIFLSSGAAYGLNFDQPVDANARSVVAINELSPQDWYGAAKQHAECRHRAMPELPIVDVRVFNYFSHTQDLSARFLIADILRAIRSKAVMTTSAAAIVRDYLHPTDFHQLIGAVLAAPPTNAVVDCYSRAPVDKFSLLQAMQERFGLRYEIDESGAGVNATGLKPRYYSLNRRAADFGYAPRLTSIDGVEQESEKILARDRHG